MSNNVRANQFPIPEIASIEFVTVLKALGDSTRLHIVSTLSDGEYHPCAAQEYGFSLHKSTLSFHFKMLREAGLTVTRVIGREHAVRLRKEELEQRFPGLMDAIVSAADRGSAGVGHSGTT